MWSVQVCSQSSLNGFFLQRQIGKSDIGPYQLQAGPCSSCYHQKAVGMCLDGLLFAFLVKSDVIAACWGKQQRWHRRTSNAICFTHVDLALAAQIAEKLENHPSSHVFHNLLLPRMSGWQAWQALNGFGFKSYPIPNTNTLYNWLITTSRCP